MPLSANISVALITYNEERYIRDAIESVLRQSHVEFELIIFDNGSTDETPKIISSYNDTRIVATRVEKNLGMSAALNRAISQCRGQYIAILAGDDVCHDDRLASQLEAYNNVGGGVIFSNVDYIDDDGQPIEVGHFSKDFFRVPRYTQPQILEALYLRGNFIHPITCFADAMTLKKVGPFDDTLVQLADYDWIVRLAKQFTITVLDRPTLKARTRKGNANLSALEPRRQTRSLNELYLVMRTFFDNIPSDLFRDAFSTHFRNLESQTLAELNCEQAFLFLDHALSPIIRLIGIEKLQGLLQDPETAIILRDQFGFMYSDFTALLLECDLLGLLPYSESHLYVNTGQGYNAVECLKQLGNHYCETFEFTYDLSSFAHIHELRWDPVELHLTDVLLETIIWKDREGIEHRVRPEAVTTNGRPSVNGWVEFQTLDPMVFLPIQGELQQITIRGQWKVIERNASAMQTSVRLANVEAALAELQRTLESHNSV